MNMKYCVRNDWTGHSWYASAGEAKMFADLSMYSIFKAGGNGTALIPVEIV